jgi:hypothetical protein
VRLSNDRGRQTFATRDLKAGDVILVERGVMLSTDTLCVRYPYPQGMVHLQDVNKQATMDVEKALTIYEEFPQARAMVYDLYPSHLRDIPITETRQGIKDLAVKLLHKAAVEPGFLKKGFSEVDLFQLFIKLNLNTFATLGKGTAIFHQASFFSHSCIANCFKFVHEDSILILAHRDIKAGEELTFEYYAFAGDSVRVHQNLAKLGFICTCPTCSDPQKQCYEALRCKICGRSCKKIGDAYTCPVDPSHFSYTYEDYHLLYMAQEQRFDENMQDLRAYRPLDVSAFPEDHYFALQKVFYNGLHALFIVDFKNYHEAVMHMHQRSYHVTREQLKIYATLFLWYRFMWTRMVQKEHNNIYIDEWSNLMADEIILVKHVGLPFESIQKIFTDKHILTDLDGFTETSESA